MHVSFKILAYLMKFKLDSIVLSFLVSSRPRVNITECKPCAVRSLNLRILLSHRKWDCSTFGNCTQKMKKALWFTNQHLCHSGGIQSSKSHGLVYTGFAAAFSDLQSICSISQSRNQWRDNLIIFLISQDAILDFCKIP